MRTTGSRTALWAIAICALLVIACSQGFPKGSADRPPAFGPGVSYLGDLADDTISEASGMAASGRQKDLLWIVNDGGNPPLIHAVGVDGSNRGRVRIRNAHNRDWEDLAAFRLDDRPYLLIADCGDNDSRRKSCFLYAVEEPRIESIDTSTEFSIPWTWRIEYSYSDGPRDCEGVAVDVHNRQILLLTKRTVPPVVYVLPLLSATKEKFLLARPLAEVHGIPAPEPEDLTEDPLFGRFRSQPTAMDISPDGKIIALLTYKRPYLFYRQGNENWPRVFARPPVPLAMPMMRQAEAMCFSPDGSSLIVTSEKLPAPLFRLDIMP